jgi:hypothetical protein
MTHNFKEFKYPIDDPNIDLNFENDILYSGLANPNFDKNDFKFEKSDIKPLDKVIRDNYKNPDSANDKSNNNYLYIVFIAVLILIIFLWYMYNKSSPTDQMYGGDTNSSSQLVMLSPDMGLGTRYSIFR